MDITLWLMLLLFIVFMGFSGFYSSTETSLFSLSQRQLEAMRAAEHPRIGLIDRLLNQPRRLIVTILICNEFVNVGASVVSATVIIMLFGPEKAYLNLFIMVPILLIVGEITPKTLAIRNNVAFASVQSKPIDLSAKLIGPVRWAVRHIADWFTTLIVGKERARGSLVTEDMVRTLAHDAVGEGELDQMEAKFIDHIFEFSSHTVGDLMTRRGDMTFIPISTTGAEVIEIFRETRQSRMPVYDDSRDNIVGILHTRDLLAIDPIQGLPDDEQCPLRSILRKPYFVPETKSASELFSNFRSRKRSFALVVDEYGGVTGVITMSDLLEAIFGDIPTPSDEGDTTQINELPNNRFTLPGATTIEDFNAYFKTDFAVDDVNTLGGLVLHHFGELPNEGDSVEIGTYLFWAQRIEANRIAEVMLEPIAPVSPEEVAEAAANPPTQKPDSAATDSEQPDRSS